MTDRDDYEARIAALFTADATGFKSWLEQMRGLTKDRHGRTVVLGLTAEETEEFLSLNLVMYPDRDRATEAQEDRYHVLREKHDIARMKDAAENLSYWEGKTTKH